jgi:hypothetical protein
MKRSLIILALVTGCGASDQSSNEAANQEGRSAVAQAVGTAGLTGLYEGAPASQPSQLCIIDKGSGNAQFGLVVWGGNMHNCSGSGGAVREGERLRLTMAGDQACAIDAKLENGTISLPATIPDGCSYYCGAGARLAGASFTQKGATAADAMKAKDLVGEPLCAGLSDGG